MIRSAIVALAEPLLAYGGVASLWRRRFRCTTLVLAYHNVVPHGERRVGVASLHLSQRDFAEQLDLVLETHDVVSLAALAEPAEHPSRPRVVITFDDAYAGALTAGLEELQRRSLPATFFVAPYFLDGRSFWWDALQLSETQAVGIRGYLLGNLQGQDARVRAWATEQGIALRQLPDHATGAPISLLREAVSRPGITCGTHSWTHPNLATLSSDEVREELQRSRAWLDDRIALTIPWVAYPYGMASREVHEVAAALGLRGGLLIEGGFVPVRTGPTMATPRLNVPAGLTREGFTLRTAGLLR